MRLAFTEDEEGIKAVLKAGVIRVLGLHCYIWKAMSLCNTTANSDCLGFDI